MKKIKTYVLMVSRTFPATHYRKGEETFFPEKIKVALDHQQDIEEFGVHFQSFYGHDPKLHTIRANKKGTAFENWSKKVKEVQEGNAIISLRYWSLSPYNYKKDGSKQVEFAQLDKDSGVGVQKLIFRHNDYFQPKISGDDKLLLLQKLANNDGLSREDFDDWFKGYDLSKQMVIIHFTKFRY